ncbi:MAG: hypothetical protein ACE5FT_02395 [Candidatus Nanoarchaeia archaeon]
MRRLVVLFVVLMLVACGAPKTGTGVTAPGEPEAPKESKFDTLQAAMDSGLGMKCTFTYKGASGDVFVKGEKFHTVVKAEGQVAHSMSDGPTMYVWAEGHKDGIMVSKAELEDAEAKHEYGVFDKDEKVPYTCFPWAISGSSFQKPSGVNFMSLTEMFEGMFS